MVLAALVLDALGVEELGEVGVGLQARRTGKT